MTSGDVKAQVDISDLIADHDSVDSVDLAALLDDALPVDLSDLVGGAYPNAGLRVEPVGLGADVTTPAAPDPSSGEGFSQPVPITIIFDDAAIDPTTAI